jgi:hypothetical protein
MNMRPGATHYTFTNILQLRASLQSEDFDAHAHRKHNRIGNKNSQ